NITDAESIKSEIITLSDPESDEVKYTIWLRTLKSNGQVIYSGVYGTCKLPSGKTCIKAVFPLPNGNATVIMSPGVGKDGELNVDQSRKKFGDAGVDVLLNDSKGDYWTRFIGSFRDRLIIGEESGHLSAEQSLTLWHQKVLSFNYTIKLKNIENNEDI